MSANPQTFFLFAAEHAALIEDLYRTREGVSEPELRRLINRHERESSPGTGYMVKRLLELRILENCPGHDARYEMTRACATLMEFLLSEYRLTDVAVIQAYLTAMDSLATEFTQAVGANDGGLLARRRMSGQFLHWTGELVACGATLIHCGDYDPTGLDEYMRLYEATNSGAQLYLPDELPQLFSRYSKSSLLAGRSAQILQRLRTVQHPAVQTVIELIHHHNAGLEQEALLLEEERRDRHYTGGNNDAADSVS